MKPTSWSGPAVALAAGLALAGAAQAQSKPAGEHAGKHVVVPAQAVQWAAAPESLPAGAQAAVLYGDPAKEGPFAMRLKLPDGYHIPPHTHPRAEIVTVVSGTARLGMGIAADKAKAQVLPAGSFFALDPGMAHYAYADGETVVQLNSSGPWAIDYINPKDDPRKR